jgi:EAL domain-containing protein (putative c-di-GMP-specific phosphodiesterase class I)
VDALKIDRGFTATMIHESGSDAIVRSTIALAHNLGLGVIAEGIEDAAQLNRLRELGCELGQGYLFSGPLSPADLEVMLGDWESAQIRASARRLALG